jgi:dTDP-4-dehydrorhamnose reductase
VLVTGATGYLGTVVAARLAGRADVFTRRLELTHPEEVAAAVGALRPEAVIHTAARNPGTEGPGARSFRAANVDGTAVLAKAVAGIGSGGAGTCRLVHVSSDVVHDGTAAPYADDAPPSPSSPYACSKAEAEAAVLDLLPGAAVVRTSLIYGLYRVDRSTAGFLERLARGERVALFRDVVRQPVHVESLADALIALALERSEVAGTLNVAGDEAIDRAAFARLLLGRWGLGLPSDAAARLDDVDAAAVAPSVPRDLRLHLRRARELGLPTPGVHAVLAARSTQRPRPSTD